MKTDLLTLTPEDFCAATKPCNDGKAFALERKTMAQVWEECPRGDWLFWILTKLAYERKTLIKLLCNVIIGTPLEGKRTVWDLMPIGSREALKVVERWADGKATEEELRAASKEAATYATAAATYATAAAYAASDAAATTYATYAASYAAYACNSASASAYAAAYAASAKKWQADYIRANVPNPFLSNT